MRATSYSTFLKPRDFGLGGPGLEVVVPSIVGPILSAMLVVNRIYWRIVLVNILGLDDCCILLSLTFLFAQCSVNIAGVTNGYGRPAATLTPSQLHRSLFMFYLDQIFYKLTINLTKLSILTLYLRVFSQRWFRLVCHGCCAIVIIYAVASIVVTVFQCTPLPYVWDKTASPTGTCIDTTAFWYANAIFNILTDVVILLSVPGVVWSLHLPRRQRLALTLVFGLGIFVFATSILRFTTLNTSSKSRDPTAGTLKSTMWTTIEASCAVICACLPMVRTPLQRVWPKLFPTKSATTADSTGMGTAPAMANGKRSRDVDMALTGSTTQAEDFEDEIVRASHKNTPQDLETGPSSLTHPRPAWTVKLDTDDSPEQATEHPITNPRIRPNRSLWSPLAAGKGTDQAACAERFPMLSSNTGTTNGETD